MEYLHSMIRVSDLEQSLDFYCRQLGMIEVRRQADEQGRYTLVFLAAPGDLAQAQTSKSPLLELTWNWDSEAYTESRNFGHLAYRVDHIYDYCQKLHESGVTINRPPRDGRMAFIRSPDQISIELLQRGSPLSPAEPWLSMPNSGHW